ncbi:MAG: twin-arginine translocase subunit TatC [Deltaproteobacteria bacterium]|jgi:sec-independent protein translocase protein TatC|nr:twin-arginine translocase subunit TatC [Deltaproteobacteria bacterium]
MEASGGGGAATKEAAKDASKDALKDSEKGGAGALAKDGKEGGLDPSDFIEADPKEAGGLSFFDHLAELRGRIIKALLSLLPGMLVCYELSGPILAFLMKPLIRLMPEKGSIIATGLAETFLIHVKIAVWAGIIVTSPFWLYQIWAFVAPGLYKKERRAIGRLTAATVVLLLLGAAFAYYVVLPIGFKFFLSFGGGDITILPVIHEYLSLVMTLLLSFGLAFELPLLLMFLASVGLIDSSKLRRFRPYALIIIVTLAAFLTPPDVISQVLMSIPMFGLYELSVILIRQKERALAREAESDGGDDDDETGDAGKIAKERLKKKKKEEAAKKKQEKADTKKKAKEEKAATKKKAKEEKAAAKKESRLKKTEEMEKKREAKRLLKEKKGLKKA